MVAPAAVMALPGNVPPVLLHTFEAQGPHIDASFGVGAQGLGKAREGEQHVGRYLEQPLAQQVLDVLLTW